MALTIEHSTEVEKASYRIYYAGIPVGKVWFWWEADATYYKMTMSLKTTGLVRIFNKQRRLAEIAGKREGAGKRERAGKREGAQKHESEAFIPIHYRSSVTYPHKKKSTDMSYQEGAVRDVVNEPVIDDMIDATEIIDAVDPMTGVLRLLTFLHDAPTNAQVFSTRIFDGKRLTQIYAASVEQDTPVTKQCQAPCYIYSLHRTPLLGFDTDEMDDYARGEPPLYIYHNADISRFPQSMRVHATFGTISIDRVKE